jgi:hypothetical protein
MGHILLLLEVKLPGNCPGKGNIYSIKIFDRALLPEEIERLALPGSSQRDADISLIDYSFDVGGSVIEDAAPTGKRVVPRNHTHVRPWALKHYGAQASRLRWVIRR